MKMHCTIAFVLIALLVEGKTDNNTTNITYNAEELTSKINNLTAQFRTRNSGHDLIRFENGNPHSSVSFEEQPEQTFKFEDDQIDQNLQDIEPEASQTFKFQDDYPNSHQYSINNGHVERPNRPLKFESDQESYSGNLGNAEEGYGFQDDNKIEEPKPLKKKRRRRRRRPRYQGFPQGYPGYPGNVGPQGLPIPAYQGYPGNGIPQGLGPSGQYPYPYPAGPINPFQRPLRRPKSIASEALSTITRALSSIAQYDDYQCVPRLLCEAAGGGALGSSGVLQSIAGLQPLLTLLAAYNGISSSPLFIFGRAVFLGMTSKGNLGTCRYGYPQCPTDPEQLVYYLNNHNGGFFRFFNSPQLPNSQNGQQNLQQFYNQLSLPQNGQYQPNIGQNYGLYPSPVQQNYGIPNEPSQQSYGFQNPNLYNNGIGPNNYGLNYPDQNNKQGYGFHNPYDFVGSQNYSPNNPYQQNNQQGYGFPNPHLHSNNIGPQNYGASFPYQNQYGLYKMKFKNNIEDVKSNRIEKRIQNKPPTAYTDEKPYYSDNLNNIDQNSNWAFPDDIKYSFHHTRDPKVFNDDVNNVRSGKTLKFPEEDTKKSNDIHNNFNRKGLFFPNDNKRYVNYYPPVPDNIYNNYGFAYQNKDTAEVMNTFNNQNNYNKLKQTYYNYQGAVDNNNQNNYNKLKQTYYNHQGGVDNNYQNNYNIPNNNNNEDTQLETVYIVRGNGDPNNPEIVKLRPGEIIQ